MLSMYMIASRDRQFYLPAPIGYKGRGGTHVEPEPMKASPYPPRLFPSATSARKALTWWLKGRVAVYCISGDGWGYGDREEWGLTPAPERKAEDWEVVQVDLMLMRSAR